MNIEFDIESFDPANGAISVRYFTEAYPSGLVYSIDVPINDGQFASQDVINELIEAFKPVGQLERLVKLQGVQIPQFLEDKIRQTIDEPSPEQPTISGVDYLPSV